MSAMDVDSDYEDDDYLDDDDMMGSSDEDVGISDEGMSDDDPEDDDDEEDDDVDFGEGDGFAPVIADKDIKKPYEVDFQVHSTDEIIKFQNEEVAHVAGILGCLPQHAATLLRHFKWNKERLIERYMEDPEAVSEKAGVVVDSTKQPKFIVIKGFECPICCMDDDDMQTIALHCGHRFCKNCYGAYLNEKIAEQGESRRIQCMEAGCKLVVDENTVRMLVDDKVDEK